MRLAVVSDIHGNIRALEAVHARIKDSSPDLTVNLGDCLSGPLWPEETAQYLMAENWPTVRGNHDRALTETSVPDPEKVDGFTHQCLSAASRQWISALPASLSLPPEILLCHGSPEDDEVFLLEEDGGDHFYPSDEAQIARKLGKVDARLILCGHTHTPRIALISGWAVLNPGSVGVQAFPGLTVTGSPHARFAIATLEKGEWTFVHHAIAYDWSEAAQRAEAYGLRQLEPWLVDRLRGQAELRGPRPETRLAPIMLRMHPSG